MQLFAVLSRKDVIFLFFFGIAASVAAAVNPYGNRTLLANSLSTFFIKGKPVFSNGPRSLSKNPPTVTS